MELSDSFTMKNNDGKDKTAGDENLQDSMQYNSQDMDQNQSTCVKPVQANTQSVNVYLNNENTDYSATITGTAFVKGTGQIASNVKILLFFGFEYIFPVYKTYTDKNGNYKIEGIPPGYYTLYAECYECVRYKSHIIKVLPCQKIDHSVTLNMT